MNNEDSKSTVSGSSILALFTFAQKLALQAFSIAF